MAFRFQHPDVIDAALNFLKANAVQHVLVAGLQPTDSYAQAMAKKVASVAMVPGDFTVAADGAARKITSASGKTGNAVATVEAGADLAFMFTDGSARILMVFESSDQAITTGNPVEFPSQLYRIPAPVAAA